MAKLLSADLLRLRRDRVFRLVLAASLLLSVGLMLNGCRQAAASPDFSYALDDYYFHIAPLTGLFCAVFTSLFLGAGHSDGALRNKLIVGHSRRDVYLSGLVTCTLASLLFTLAWLLGGLVGVPFLGPWQMGAAALAAHILPALLFTAALASIFTLAGMCFTNRAYGAVFSILLFLVLLFLGSYVYNRLCEPEFFSGVVITVEGMVSGEPTPNPDYLTGTLRRVYEFLADLLPTSQGILLANGEVARPLRMALCSLGLAAASTLCGVALFRRQDLK